MKKNDSARELDCTIEQITADSSGDDETLRAFQRKLAQNIDLPCDAFVIDQPVSLIGFEYEGNQRRGIVARCRLEQGIEYTISAADIALAPRSNGHEIHEAYRKWVGLNPRPTEVPDPSDGRRQHKAEATDLDLSAPVELVILSIKENSARCRLPHTGRVITLRTSQLWNIAPGEIAVVKPRKQWTYAGHPYLSGKIESSRIDVSLLGLLPLKLQDKGIWKPDEEYWGEEGEPIEEWAKAIIARGPRPSFEMEQVVPGRKFDDFDSDPILIASEEMSCGNNAAARKILMKLCEADLRCLDAHAHLGNFAFDHSPEEAFRHYQVGVRIGELSLGSGFEGVLLWGHIDNRPYLRCLHGSGLCLWRLGRFEEAESVFESMLWLNPSDNQGIRLMIDEVRARDSWEERASTRGD